MENPEKISELYILDHKLNLLCSIKEFNKLEWTERIYEADSFSIEMPFEKVKNTQSSDYAYYQTIYEALISSSQNGYYPRFIITNSDDKLTNIGYIENYKFIEEETLEIQGEGFLKFFEKRATITKKYIPSEETRDECGRVMCRIINDNNTAEQTTFIPYLVANEDDNAVGVDIYVECETKDNIYKKLNTLAKAYEVCMMTLCNPFEKKVYFKTFKYEKHDDETANALVLSENDGNIISIEYEVDNGKYYNYIVVEGENGIKGIVDNRENKEEQPALETYKKSSKKRGDLDRETYIKLLESEGIEELTKKKVEENFKIEPTSDIKAVLGSYVYCKIDLGYGTKIKQLPITEIKHIIENGEYTKEISFGNVFNLKNELIQSLGV